MTSPTEAATWANLQSMLEGKLTDWNVPNARGNAEGLVCELRRSGWRIPLPDHTIRNESWKQPRTRPARTEASQRYIEACRAAIKAAADA